MGKKLKGGRRQILQLEEKKPPKTVSKPKVKSLIHYSDSDEDSKKSNESESSVKVQAPKDATPMDSEIADFFKEIDALTVPEELGELSNPSPTENAPVKPDNSEAPNSVPQLEDSDLPQNKVDQPIEEQKEEISCAWQEIPDESTGYSYYWNMHTNEVTWDCPEEYAKYVQSLNEAAKLQAEDKSAEANSKKAKRKKEPEKLLEGAIIPISYYGSSSSDESSESENESPKPLKRPKIEQPIIAKKNKVSRKKDRKKGSHKTDIIGPQLPPDFLVEPPENAVYGPCLPPNYSDILKDGAPSESISVSMDVSLPETSLKSAKKSLNAKEDEENIGLSVNNAGNSSTRQATVAYGLKSVVDYGSFTDEEEDEESNDVAPPNQTETKIPNSKVTEDNTSTKAECPVAKDKEDNTENETTVYSMITSLKNDKPNVTNESKIKIEKLKIMESLPKDTKRTDVDIDSIFAAHSSYGKYGFGLGFREHSDEEIEVSSPSRQVRKSYRNQTDIKPMSFVKSKSVLDLGSLNEVLEESVAVSCDIVEEEVVPVDSKSLDIEEKEEKYLQKETSEDLSLVTETATEGNSHVTDESSEGHPIVTEETSGGCLKVTEEDVPMHTDDEASVSNEVVLTEECVVDEVMKAVDDIAVDDLKPNSDDLKVLVEESSSDSSSFDLTDDLDEIDKALCEALDKKKAKNKASIPSDFPSTEVNGSNLDSTCMEPNKKQQISVEESKLKLKEDSAYKARIIEMASILTDKLTFLLSNSTSTLQSLNSLYIQLQTRLVDWQANALDSVYFEARLKEVDTYLTHYETGVVSGDWTCQWDRYGHIPSFCPNPPSYELLNMSHLYLYIRIIDSCNVHWPRNAMIASLWNS